MYRTRVVDASVSVYICRDFQTIVAVSSLLETQVPYTSIVLSEYQYNSIQQLMHLPVLERNTCQHEHVMEIDSTLGG